MKITPRAGDYVKTAGMTDDKYNSVIQAFIGLGFGVGESNRSYPAQYFRFIGIGKISKAIFYSDKAGDDSHLDGRELSLSDLLGDDDNLGCAHDRGVSSSGAINTHDPVWNGDGWPPVGTECEFSYNKVNWFETKILFRDRTMAVFTTDHTDETERSAFLREIIFRPLKSERDIAIEELERFIDNPCIITPHGIAITIYEAGYRKIKDAEK